MTNWEEATLKIQKDAGCLHQCEIELLFPLATQKNFIKYWDYLQISAGMTVYTVIENSV